MLRGDAKCTAQGLISVAQKGEGQLMACCEAPMTDGVIPTDAPHLSTQGLQFAVGIAKATGFRCASRGVVFGIKKQHQRCAIAFADRTALAVVVLKLKGGCAVTNAEGH